MVLLLMECAGDEMDSDDGTEMWLNMIDRGGLWNLWHVIMTKPTVCLKSWSRKFAGLGALSRYLHYKILGNVALYVP